MGGHIYRNDDPARIKPFLKLVAQEWEKHPELRFGQLVSCMAGNADDIYYQIRARKLHATLVAWR